MPGWLITSSRRPGHCCNSITVRALGSRPWLPGLATQKSAQHFSSTLYESGVVCESRVFSQVVLARRICRRENDARRPQYIDILRKAAGTALTHRHSHLRHAHSVVSLWRASRAVARLESQRPRVATNSPQIPGHLQGATPPMHFATHSEDLDLDTDEQKTGPPIPHARV